MQCRLHQAAENHQRELAEPLPFVAGVESDRPPTRTATTVSSAARTSASGNQLLHVAVACYAARRPSTSGHQRRPCQLLPSSSKPGSCLYSRHSKHTCRCMLTCKSAYERSTTAHRLHVSILAIYKSYTQSPSASLQSIPRADRDHIIC